jgi:hypothetical protein
VFTFVHLYGDAASDDCSGVDFSTRAREAHGDYVYSIGSDTRVTPDAPQQRTTAVNSVCTSLSGLIRR